MTRFFHPLHACLLVGAVVLLVSGAQAQTDDALLSAAARRGPAVATVLDLPREAPADRLTAIFTLLDLGETDVAEALFKPLVQAKLDEQTRAKLVGKFGTARFLNLARREKPAGESSSAASFAGARVFVAGCLQAAAAQARDPERLAQIIANLNDDSPEVRKAARVDLATTGSLGAAACLQALSSTDDPQARRNLMLALAPMRPEVDALLVAALAEGNGRSQRDAAELAGHLELFGATSWLAALAVNEKNDPSTLATAQAAITKLGLSQPSPADARAILLSELGRLEAGIFPSYLTSGKATLWWLFDEEKKQLVPRELPSDERQRLALARLTRTLAKLPIASAEDRQLALSYAQEVAHRLSDQLPADLQGLAEAMSTSELNETLARSVQQNRLGAAIATLGLLGERGDFAALSSTGGGKPSPLVRAIEHTDSNVRFAALTALMQISPQRSFAGASGVPKALWNFTASDDTSRASQSLEWLGQLLAGGSLYDELLRESKLAGQSLYRPQLTEPSLRVLTLLGTAGSQMSLVDFASQRPMPIENRRQAADAFATSVKRFGLLLTTTEILQQYDRYNASEAADRDTQLVLGQLLDVLESQRKTKTKP